MLTFPIRSDTITFLGKSFVSVCKSLHFPLILFKLLRCLSFSRAHVAVLCLPAHKSLSGVLWNTLGILVHGPPCLSFTFYCNKPLFTHLAACSHAGSPLPHPMGLWTPWRQRLWLFCFLYAQCLITLLTSYVSATKVWNGWTHLEVVNNATI